MKPPEYDSLHARGRYLEEMFCLVHDQKLLDNLRRKLSTAETEKVLATAIGIADELSLKAISKVEAGVQVLAAMALLPLVEVAWCDGELAVEERGAILKAAVLMEISHVSPVYHFLEQSLQRRPSREAIAAWKKYVHAICDTLEPATVQKLRSSVIGRAESIAKSAGGIMGFGSKISSEEQACLDDLAKAFDRASA